MPPNHPQESGEQEGRTVRTLRYLLLTMLSVVAISGYSYSEENQDLLFQVSAINALLEGVYDGDISYGQLKRYGNFGIGTFNSLDGEMIGLEGKFYQITAQGLANVVDDEMKTPFAVVTFFEPDRTVLLPETLDYGKLEEYLDRLLPTKNIFYAVKIEGVFEYVKTRSVPRQNKPYLPLVEVLKNQPTFEFRKVKGTVVGFRCPLYVTGINVPGYHLHFIREDRKAGGHVLECRPENVRVEIDHTLQFHMVLPEDVEFYKADLGKEKHQELEKVEK